MTYQTIILLLVIGVFAGMLSGLVGIGGGVVIVPALVLLLGFSQHMAQGTTLAMMVPPVGILAVYSYYQDGKVDVKTAAILCVGFLIGGAIGGKIVIGLSDIIVRRIFSVLVLLISLKMFFTK
ncbi:MAG: sulfite exporter TauE/SafE family protein [Opitutaceae bacterium]|nr:sulfite exporter TauE/SafE family protein [Cytophagales bacterium]